MSYRPIVNKTVNIDVKETTRRLNDSIFDREVSKRVNQRKISDSSTFNAVIGVVIIVNMFMIGLENDLAGSPSCISVTEKISSQLIWFVFDNLFTFIFFLEMVIRLYSDGRSFFRVRHGGVWNILDFVLVLVGVIDTWILSFALPCTGLSEVRVLLSLRVLRTLRLVRLVKLLKSFKELWLIVTGLVNSIITLLWVSVLLIGLLYVCAIFTTTQIGQSSDFTQISYDGSIWPHQLYFGSVFKSMLTLWQIATLDSWADGIVRHVIYRQPAMVLFFAVFILLTTFGIFNIIIGVIVENTMGLAVAQGAEQDKTTKEHEMKAAVQSLRKVFELSDTDRSGTVSRSEFKAACKLKEVQEKFESLDIEPHEAEELFNLIDTADKDHISLNDFVTACMQLIGGANQSDIMQVSLVVDSLAKKVDILGRRITQVENCINELNKSTNELVEGPLVKLTGYRIDN